MYYCTSSMTSSLIVRPGPAPGTPNIFSPPARHPLLTFRKGTPAPRLSTQTPLRFHIYRTHTLRLYLATHSLIPRIPTIAHRPARDATHDVWRKAFTHYARPFTGLHPGYPRYGHCFLINSLSLSLSLTHTHTQACTRRHAHMWHHIYRTHLSHHTTTIPP